VPVSAADVAAVLEEACVDAIVTVDLHDEQTAGFYSPRCAFHNANYIPVAARFLVRHGLSSPVVVAPHASTVTRAMEFVRFLIQYKEELGMYFEGPASAAAASAAFVATGAAAMAAMAVAEPDAPADGSTTTSRRAEALKVDAGRWRSPPSVAMLLAVERHGAKEFELTGDVAGRDAVIVDDLIDSGNTLARSSRELMVRGASRVFAFATHGLLSADAADKLAKAPIDLLVVTNTVASVTSKLPADHGLRRKMAVLSVAPMLAHYICEHADLPLPDVDPLVPTYAMHSGTSAPPGPSWQHMASTAERIMLEEDSLQSETASVAESQTTASEFSATAILT